MDQYIDLFFMNRPDLKYNPDVGDITHRQMLRKKLQCKNFDWFLRNVYPEKFVPTQNVQAYGRIKSAHNICLDDLQNNNEQRFKLGVYGCHGGSLTKSQFFSFTLDGVLRNEGSCATLVRNLIEMVPCQHNDSKEKWTKTPEGHLIHIGSGLCLDSKGLQNKDHIQVAACERDSETQIWTIEH